MKESEIYEEVRLSFHRQCILSVRQEMALHPWTYWQHSIDSVRDFLKYMKLGENWEWRVLERRESEGEFNWNISYEWHSQTVKSCSPRAWRDGTAGKVLASKREDLSLGPGKAHGKAARGGVWQSHPEQDTQAETSSSLVKFQSDETK